MKILSLFDGISCARVALERAGIPVYAYYASEINEHAIGISRKNYKDIEHYGDVKNLLTDYTGHKFDNLDLLIGGSPCQDLSIAKKNRKGLDGKRSGLFWEYVRILHEVKPKYFILENVASMPKEAKDIISEALGVQPIMINASLVSAQNRKRLFWTNIPGVTQPDDKGIYLKDILEINPDESTYVVMRGRYITKGKSTQVLEPNYLNKTNTLTTVSKDNLIYLGHINRSNGQANRIYAIDGKSVTLSSQSGGLGAKTGMYIDRKKLRILTPVECERLQCLPDGYTKGISDNQRRVVCGNAFNVDVVAHILSFIKL
jgi:DNA (cytosine-5)-methyltransferase 3A